MIGLNGSNLIGLPKEYQPAKLDLENGILSIAEKKLVFTPFLKNIFVETVRSDIRISSSWYHDPKIMPPYIDLRMTPKGRDFSYHVIVDMKNMVKMKVPFYDLTRSGVTFCAGIFLIVTSSQWAKKIVKQMERTRRSTERSTARLFQGESELD